MVHQLIAQAPDYVGDAAQGVRGEDFRFMRKRRLFDRVGSIAAILVLGGVAACGPSTDDADASGQTSNDRKLSESRSIDPKGSDESEPTTAPEPQVAQDICAELDDATVQAIADALGGKTRIKDYSGTATGATYIPPVDECELAYTGRPVSEQPEADGKVIIQGNQNLDKGEIRLNLTSVPMTEADFERIRKQSVDEAHANQATFKDVDGLGDAAFYSELESNVLVGDRILGIRVVRPTKAEIVKIARAVVAAVGGLPPAPAEVTLPPCDPLTSAAEAAIGAEILVRRDAKNESRTFCGWANATTSFQVNVSGDDDPKQALAELRNDPSTERVNVGDEGFYVTSPYRQVIFRKGDHHYQAYFWASTKRETTKRKTVAAVQRFADRVE
jgi:hypothetical protein